MLQLASPSAFLRTGPQMMQVSPDSGRISSAICTACASRMESAYLVVSREGNAPSLAPWLLLAPLAEAGACSRCLPHSLADERHVCSLDRPRQRRAGLAQHGGARFPTLAAYVRRNNALRGRLRVPRSSCIPPV
jgi:hypothetical protein